VQLLTLPQGARAPRTEGQSVARVTVAKVLAVGAVAAYNWWVVVLFVPGLMPSINGFFSDLEATGRPHADLMSDADMLAGVLLLAALLLRGPFSRGVARREWAWMVTFAVVGAVGGRFPYACSEGLSATCRQMEWHLQLPAHHYVHVVSGITEFVTLTVATVLATRRTRGIRILAGIKGIATPPGLRYTPRLLHNRRRCRNLLLLIGWLPTAWRELHRRRRRDAGLGDTRLRDTWLGHTWLSAGGDLRAALKRPQAVLELAVAVLQFLVLAGELAQLILELLNAHFRVDGIGLRQSL